MPHMTGQCYRPWPHRAATWRGRHACGVLRSAAMKVFLSFDMEGVAGIVDWDQCVGPGADYQMGCRLTLGEVNAAIDGALEGGADEILVNDSHWKMENLPPDELHGNATYL